MKIIDKVFGWLLVVGSLLHAIGSFAAYKYVPETLLWALSTSLAGLLLAGINLLRVGRPGDHTLAWLSFAGSVAWIIMALAFGKLIGNLFDFRVLIHAFNALVLAGFSLRSALAEMPMQTSDALRAQRTQQPPAKVAPITGPRIGIGA